ncbi:hypothetical protein PLESTB_000957700 [Pleodorina starrii]|uniref:N-acetyltransferase domain-containing protein n=1 Tax=Pleodorina starrii TaxID=330485 RepID=A0A9W6C4Z9_9CHLO|nr:hypothetical protein PLESTM_001140500 [Pleodorina starrii]GLC77824.1 hypothetical protein PLESTB_000957700 [Pleodorina starrii]
MELFSGRRSVAAFCATAAEVASSGTTPASSGPTESRPPQQTDPTGTTATAADAPAATIAAAAPPSPPSVDATFTSLSGAQSWRVRPYDNADYAAIVDVQTDSFHTSNPVPFLNALTYNNFRAEVVDALRQKTKYSHPSTFQLLVVEELPPSHTSPPHSESPACSEASSSSRVCGGGGGMLVGSVEISLMQEREVLKALPRTPLPTPTQADGGGDDDCYAYVSSMCVRTASRRRGVAQALMAAAEAQAQLWRQRRLALHVYKDNAAAVELYLRCGLRVLAEDPGWKAMLPGGRVRLLMYKEVPPVVGGEEEEVEGGRE